MTTRGSARRALAGAAAIAVATAALAACTPANSSSSENTSSSSSGNSITVGLTLPLSGPLATYGVIADGMTAYFDSVNAGGGIDGKHVTLKVLDDAYQPAQSLTNVRRLVLQDNADVVTAFGDPSETDRDYMQSAKVPFIVLDGDGAVDYSSKYSWVRPGAISDQRSDVMAMAKFTSKKFPGAKVGLLTFDNGVASTIVSGLKLGLSNGATLADTQLYPSTATDLSGYVNKLHAAGITDIYIQSGAPTLAATLKYIAQIKWHPRVYVFQNNASIASAMSVVGAAADGVYSAFYFKDPDDPQWSKDADMTTYRQTIDKYSHASAAPSLFTLMGYATAEAIVRALRNSKDATGQKFLDGWDNIRDATLIGFQPGVTISYNPVDGRLIHSIQMVQFENKSWRAVGPMIHTTPLHA